MLFTRSYQGIRTQDQGVLNHQVSRISGAPQARGHKGRVDLPLRTSGVTHLAVLCGGLPQDRGGGGPEPFTELFKCDRNDGCLCPDLLQSSGAKQLQDTPF